MIRSGYDSELDNSRELRDGGRRFIAAIQQRERERTGIASLKLGYKTGCGYYLQVTQAPSAKVPPD